MYFTSGGFFCFKRCRGSEGVNASRESERIDEKTIRYKERERKRESSMCAKKKKIGRD